MSAPGHRDCHRSRFGCCHQPVDRGPVFGQKPRPFRQEGANLVGMNLPLDQQPATKITVHPIGRPQLLEHRHPHQDGEQEGRVAPQHHGIVRGLAGQSQ